MSTWIDCVVYATWMAVYWFLLPVGISRTGLLWAADRNPEWLRAHPDAAARLADGRTYLRTCYSFGALSLAALASCQLGFWPAALSAPRFEPEHWLVLKDLNVALAIFMTAFYVGSTFLFKRALRAVPHTEQRSASLVRRTVEDFVPRAFRLGVYVLASAHIAAWLAAGACLTYLTPHSWPMYASRFGGAALAFAMTQGVLLWVVHVVVNRPPSLLDRLYAGYRVREVRTAFALNLLPPLTGSLRLYGDLTASVDAARLSHLGIALGIALLGAWVMLAPNVGARGAAPPSGAGLLDGTTPR